MLAFRHARVRYFAFARLGPRRLGARRLVRVRRSVGGVPNEQNLAVAIERGRRLRHDLGERLIRAQPDLRDAADRVTRREHTAEAGRDEQVALLDVLVVRQVRQPQQAAVAGTDCDRAQAVAVDADRHRGIRVGDQHRLGRERPDSHGLADDALRVDQRLADVHAVDETAVQVEALAVRIEIDRENLGDQRAATDPRLAVEQLAQPRVLGLERCEALEPELGIEPLALELLVLGDERLARCEGVRIESQPRNGKSTSTRSG